MKIYTRTGDGGTTSLYGGQRVPKDAHRVEAYGTVDELNSVIGVAHACQPDQVLGQQLLRLQHELFDCGADLANPKATEKPNTEHIKTERIDQLEKEIDQFTAEVLPLRQFILPGGSPLGAALHHARTVARRAERCAVKLNRDDPIDPLIIRYLNRLSDWLFAAARVANVRQGFADIIWNPSQSSGHSS